MRSGTEARITATCRPWWTIRGKPWRRAGYIPYYLYRQKNIVGTWKTWGYAKPGFYGKYNVYIMEEVQTILAVGAGAVSKVVRPGRIDRVFNYKYRMNISPAFPIY